VRAYGEDFPIGRVKQRPAVHAIPFSLCARCGRARVHARSFARLFRRESHLRGLDWARLAARQYIIVRYALGAAEGGGGGQRAEGGGGKGLDLNMRDEYRSAPLALPSAGPLPHSRNATQVEAGARGGGATSRLVARVRLNCHVRLARHLYLPVLRESGARKHSSDLSRARSRLIRAELLIVVVILS